MAKNKVTTERKRFGQRGQERKDLQNDLERDLRLLAPWGPEGWSNAIANGTAGTMTIPQNTHGPQYMTNAVNFTSVGGVVFVVANFQRVTNTSGVSGQTFQTQLEYSTDGTTFAEFGPTYRTLIPVTEDRATLVAILQTTKQKRYTVRMRGTITGTGNTRGMGVSSGFIYILGNIAETS
jgi:hypothetical protein